VLDYVLADDIPQFDNHTHSQLPEMEILPKERALINDTAQVNSFDDDDRDYLAPVATPQQL